MAGYRLLSKLYLPATKNMREKNTSLHSPLGYVLLSLVKKTHTKHLSVFFSGGKVLISYFTRSLTGYPAFFANWISCCRIRISGVSLSKMMNHFAYWQMRLTNVPASVFSRFLSFPFGLFFLPSQRLLLSILLFHVAALSIKFSLGSFPSFCT